MTNAWFNEYIFAISIGVENFKKMTVENTIVLIAGLGCAGGINYYFGNEIGILSKITNAVLIIIGGASIEKLRREWKLRFR